jgi:hypothetical protein
MEKICNEKLKPNIFELMIFHDVYKITKSLEELKKDMNQKNQNNKNHVFEYENLGWQVILVNNSLTIAANKFKFKIFKETPVNFDANVKIPQGLHVFKGPTLNFDQFNKLVSKLFNFVAKNKKNLAQIHPMYTHFKHRMRGNNYALFDDDSTRDFLLISECLKIYDFQLFQSILECGRYCTKIMGLPDEQLNKCHLQIIHYNPNKGLLPHIDAVHTHNNSVGPTFTFNLDKGVKIFDLLPTLDSNGTPCRLFTTQGQCTVMDNVARLLWTHAIPSNLDYHRYSLVFKFPEMQRLDVIFNEFFNIEIPVNII